MQAGRRSAVREAVASLMVAALDDLAKNDGAPKVHAIPDLRNWWRYGQESFVALRPNAWHLPERARIRGPHALTDRLDRPCNFGHYS